MFDLYVSVPDEVARKKVKHTLSKIVNAKIVNVRVSPNRGRDFGSMYVLFGDELRKHDYILHIHSKKSLRTNQSQDPWRQYMLNAVLGDSSIVRRTVALLNEPNIGVIIPDTHESVPYWAHTWLGASSRGREFSERLGIEWSDKYMDFSAGSFFWAKAAAIDGLFATQLTWEDFDTESGQEDGSLEYVLERIYIQLAQSNGYDFATLENGGQYYMLNHANKQLQVYENRNEQEIKKFLSSYDVVSFDIFDTLVTRRVLDPDDIFTLIDKRLKHDRVFLNFKKFRKEAEDTWRNEHPGIDCTIDDIYESFARITGISIDKSKIIADMERSYEIRNVVAKKDALELYNHLLERNKKIVLISDMYLDRATIEEMLHTCGYFDYYDLLISSEQNARKDNGKMWNLFFRRYSNVHHIHVGDNEESDIHALTMRKKTSFHVLGGRKLFELTSYGEKMKKHTGDQASFAEKTIMGLLTNKVLFNQTILYKDMSALKKLSLHDFGYSALGPIFLYYFQWLVKNIKDDDNDQDILFVAREGYFLKKLYEKVRERLNDNNLDRHNAIYFLASRRASSVASIADRKDVENILSSQYEGTVRSLFYYRLGIDIKINDFEVSMPSDTDKIQRIISDNLDAVYENAKIEKENYYTYIRENVRSDSDVRIVDLGYSGSFQYYLSKLLDKKTIGNYFVVSKNIKPLALGCTVESCFNDSIYDKDLVGNPIYKYSLILEGLLTAPQGQFVRFDKNEFGKLAPVYNNEIGNTANFSNLEMIYSGVEAFIDDFFDVSEDDFIGQVISKDLVLDNFNFIARDVAKNNRLIIDMLNIEDFYSQNGEINIIDYMQEQM